MTGSTVLVTGGAGYIGSHTSRLLQDAGFRVLVLDNLYSGHRWAVPSDAVFQEGNAGDPDVVSELHQRYQFDSVIHFAGHIVVPESVADPVKYYRNNVVASLELINQSRNLGVRNFIFSSSAAVYGIPAHNPVNESTPAAPINPYGASKLITEWTLKDIAESARLVDQDFRFVALRYFNVAGASLDASIGQATPEATHLIKVACETASGKRSGMRIFGTDYDTRDGTCIRDYIHVMDLADAHIRALGHLQDGGDSQILNCGYGHGFSVREVLDSVERVTGVQIPIELGPRRAGDPPSLVADNQRIRDLLQWQPRYDDLDTICQTAWNWEQKLSAT